MSKNRGLLGSLLALGIALASPAAANAFVTVSVSGNTLQITGTNVAPSPQVDYTTVGTDRFQIFDAGGATAGAGCDNDVNVNTAECDDGGITSVVLTAQAGAGTVMNGTVTTFVPATVAVTLNGGDGNEVFTSGNGNDTLHGNAGSNDINGGSGNDTIDSTGVGSQIYTGDDGADVLIGSGGNNILTGGTDAVDSDDEGDQITGGPLIDDLNGSGGGDTINGGDDDDNIHGGEGNDTVNAGPGDDSGIGSSEDVGGPGNDTINGDAGDDQLDGGENPSAPEDSDTLNGGADDDLLINSEGADAFNGGANNAGASNGDEADYSVTPNTAAITADIDGASGDDGRSGEGDSLGLDIEHLTGDGGADTLTGDTDANRIDGDGGDDVLRGGGGSGPDGADNFVGGSSGGTGDTVSYDLRTDAIAVTIEGTANDGGGGCPAGAGCEDDDVETSVENLTGGSAADSLTGSGSPNVLRGGSGTAIDTFEGEAGNDTLHGGTGTNSGPDGGDEFDGGADADEVSYATRSDDIVADPGGGNEDGGGGCPSGAGCEDDDVGTDVEDLTGGSGDDTFTGNDVVNVLVGQGGDDTLAGGTTTGATDGADVYDGGSGSEDTVTYAARTADLIATIGQVSGADSDDIGSDVENLIGGSGDDDLTGDGDANELTGGGGDDDMQGAAGTGADGADVFTGGTHGTAGGLNGNLGDLARYSTRTGDIDITIGGGANDGAGGCPSGGGCEDDNVGADVERVFGGSGDDVLIGDAQVNDLFGGAGGDTISGGAGSGPDGADLLDGGGHTTTGDTLSYSTRTDALSIQLGGAAPDGDQIFTGFENVTGGSGSDVIRGDANANILSGGGGDDELRGGTITGPDGADDFNGGSNGTGGDTVNYAARSTPIDATIGASVAPTDGDDIAGDVENLTGGSGNDILRGDGDPNVISGEGGDDLMTPTRIATTADGPDTVIGGANGAGGDTALYGARTDPLVVGIGGGANDGAGCATPAGCEGDDIQADVENLSGGDAGDALTGDADANSLLGSSGDDVLAGGTGPGPDGADQFQGQAAGPLGDTVTYANRADTISADIAGGGDDTDGDNLFSDIDNIVGGSGADTLGGSPTPNRITGGAGADTINALAGADTVFARDGEDDTIDCGTEADVAELDLLPLDDPATGCETANRAQFTPPVVNPPAAGGGGGGGAVVNPPAAPPAQKKTCKKGQKLKKGKCVKKKRRKR